MELRAYVLFYAATFFFVAMCTVEAVILEHPQTQYALVGDRATFHCRATGDIVYWTVNNDTITSTHHDNIDKYEGEGFVFCASSDKSRSIHNLTIDIPASKRVNNTLIECRVIGNNYEYYGESEKAYLYVFMDLRSYPPTLRIDDASCHTISRFVGTIHGTPLWPGYIISEFRLNITNSSNGKGVVLKQITIPLNGHLTFFYFNETLAVNVKQFCSSLFLISATALSPTYGESMPVVKMYTLSAGTAAGNISDPSVDFTVLFFPNGTPFLFTEIKLPDTLCTCQLVNYTIEIEDMYDFGVESAGPFTHMGPGIVKHNIYDILENNRTYSMVVRLASAGQTSESMSFFFNTTLKFNSNSCTFGKRSDIIIFQLTTGVIICLVMAVVMFSVIIILFGCDYVHKKREHVHVINTTASRVHNMMVPNPVYDGPVYESIQPRLETLVADSQPVTTTSMREAASQCHAYDCDPLPDQDLVYQVSQGHLLKQ